MRRWTQSLEERFWSKVDRRGSNECWPWLAAVDVRGYGRFHYGRRRMVLAHRMAVHLARGVALDGPWISCHSCDNPPCCNPAHVRSATQADNVAEMHARGRNVPLPTRRGRALKHTKLDENSVRKIRAEYLSGHPQRGARPLARKYGVSQPAIQQIVRRLTWRHVEEVA